MWLENSPVSHPLTGLRCINWYAGCDMATSLILPQTTDASGFYGATVTSGGAKWMHGMMSDAFYQYLQQMPVGGSFTMTINACQTSVNYDASSGARCKDQASGNWYVRNVTHTKAANLRLINTHSLGGGVYQQRWRADPRGRERRLPDADHRQPLRIKL